MHWLGALSAHAQQSDVCAHFSYSWEHPLGVVTHSNAGPPSAPVVWRQKPLQH
jgi:hypothetical protein